MGLFYLIYLSCKNIKPSIIQILSILLLLLTLISLPQPSIASNNAITIGILAHRPKPETLTRFQPLVKQLEKELPNQKVNVEVFSYPELETALAADRLDFVLTNPGHYVQLRHQHHLSGALATLIEQEGGHSISSFGGVIFTLRDRADIVRLEHLKGKRISIVGTGSLGGYQAQAFELLQVGVHLPKDAGLVVTGMPHDMAVQAVFDGRADAGMVRTGVLEEMVKEGKLDLGRLKILNQKKTADFPYVTSTRLYPQWPFFALPHVPEDTARRVATALLQMPHTHQPNGLEGFTIAADYSSVENLLSELRLPPFENGPGLDLIHVWQHYSWQILAALLAIAIMLLLGIRLIFANRKLIENELRYRTVADFTSDWEYWLAPDKSFQYMSPSCEQVCGYTAEEFYRDPQLLPRIIHPDDQHLYTNHIHQRLDGSIHEPFDFRVITRDGHVRWISHSCRTVLSAEGKSLGQRSSNRDITERKQLEDKLNDLMSQQNLILENASVGITFVRDRVQIWANPKMSKIFGYPLAGMEHQSTRMFYPSQDAFEEFGNAAYPMLVHGESYETDCQMQRSDGSLIWVSVRGKAINPDDLSLGSIWILADISEQKLAENEVIKSRDRLNEAQRLTHIGSWELDIETGQLEWSDEIYVIFGIEPGSPQSIESFTACIHPEDREQVIAAWSQALTGKEYSVDHRIIVGEHTKWVHERAELIFDRDGKPISGIGTVQDISELVNVEEKRRESEEMYRTIFESSIDALSIIDPDTGMFIDCNETAVKLHETGTRRNFLGKSPDMLSPLYQPNGELSSKLAMKFIQQAVIEGKVTFEFTNSKSDGTTFPALVSLCSIQLNKKKHVLAIARDFTDRKRFENDLIESRQLMASIIDFLPDATFVVDNEMKVIAWNRAMEEMTGVSKDEMLGQGDHAYTVPFYGDRRKQLLDLLDISDSELEAKYEHVERKGGTLYAEVFADALNEGNGAYLWASGAALCSSDEKRVGAIEVIRDISDRKRAEVELQQAMLSADKANRAKSEFLSNMSHEIRTPMNGVIGMTQLLEMTDLTDEQQEYTTALKGSGENLLSLINDILDLSKIEAGKIELELGKFSLQSCINNIVLTQKSAIFAKRLALNVEVAPDIPRILLGDQLRLKQILLNLLGNAVKFTTQGSITLSAQLFERHGDSVIVQIAVKDTGIGIPAEALDKIFKPFVQADGSTSRKYGGTGLGLTISSRLAELLNGNISVESSPGAGSCFTVTIPFELDSSEDSVDISSTTSEVCWDGAPLRVLFAEDNSVSTMFGISLLKKLGHEVIAVGNGKECLDALEQNAFDFVLMDIQMPIMNGEEALREIRRKEQGTTFHIPVIALTAYALRGEKERFLEEGFDGFVSKPLDVTDLMREMKRVL
jgi:PAS domain S-box-containing protein